MTGRKATWITWIINPENLKASTTYRSLPDKEEEKNSHSIFCKLFFKVFFVRHHSVCNLTIIFGLKITQNVTFEFWHFPPIFDLLKLNCLVTLFDRKLQVFKNSPKWTISGIFIELLSTQNVNVARFARNVE